MALYWYVLPVGTFLRLSKVNVLFLLYNGDIWKWLSSLFRSLFGEQAMRTWMFFISAEAKKKNEAWSATSQQVAIPVNWVDFNTKDYLEVPRIE